MIYRWNPGWRDAILAVFCVVCPAIMLVVRSKWKRSEIRRQEVRRLARMAAAEAEMAEKEAAEFIYAVQKQLPVVDGGVIGTINCAVCLKPTTTRCSRCKAVRYCSGSCQIIHWRDGHKYECHPPVADDHYKGPSHISNINRGLDKRSEISRDGSIEGKSQATNYGFCVDQSVSNMVEEQSEHSVLVGSRLDIEVKTDNIKPLETISTIPVSSEFKASSRIHSENGVDLEEHFVCISEKGSTIDSLPSGYSTICGSVEMINSASSDEDLTKAPPGQHPYEDALNNLDEFFSSSDKQETSVVNVNQVNLPIIPPGKIVADSLGLKPNMKRAIDETKLKSSAPSRMSTPKHDKSTDSGINKNAGDFISMGLCSSKFDKSENSTFSDSYCENQGDNLDLDASTTVSCAAESQNCQSIQYLQRVSDKPPKVNNGFVLYGKALKGAVQLSAPLSSSLSKRNQLELHNYGPGNFNYKALFPYDYFIKLYNSDKVAISPSGLVNCGNSCYANAVLQCLAFTRPLAAFVLDGFHAKACPKKSWCFLCEFEALLIKVKQGKSPVSPSGIMAHIGGNFCHGMEEDAHEFLRYSIDALQSACLKEVDATAACELAEETTLIQLIFGGYLRSKIKCLSCQGKSERRERMMDLTIDVYGDIGTLEDALARFTASEILVGENKYKCDRCNSFQQAKKQLTVLEAPNVLTIALKRYQNGKYGKLDRMVRFSEYLNLAPYMRGSDDNSPVYRLYAVVVHNGHSNATFSGHYVCYVKNSQGKWFKTDDSAVKSVELEQVLSQRAYLLLYTRCSPRAPSSLRNEMAKTSRKAKKEQRANSAGAGFSKAAESWSDISSIFSFSDEGSSWSTASTKDSAASDDLPDCYGPSASSSISEDSLPLSSSSYSISSSSNREAWINTYFLPPKPNVLLRRPGGTNANGDDRTARSFY